MPKITMTVNNEVGLHARPATLFVQTAKAYPNEIKIYKNNLVANAKSIISILTLGVCKGDEITIEADGDGSEKALDGLRNLVESNFGELTLKS